MLAIACGTVALIVTDDPPLAAGVAVGCLLGQVVTPDLDQAETRVGAWGELASFALWTTLITIALLELRK
jgi:hypothetical protein